MKAIYRIVNALLAAAIFPVILLMDLFYFRVSTNLVEAGLHETIGFMDFVDIYRGDHLLSTFINSDTVFVWPEELAPLNARLIACIVSLVLIVAIAIFIIIWSCCSNKRMPVLIASILGVVSAIVLSACFASASRAITSGVIDLVKAIGGSGIISSLVGSFINIEAIDLAGFQNGILITYIVLIIWTASFYIIEIGEPKEEEAVKDKKH